MWAGIKTGASLTELGAVSLHRKGEYFGLSAAAFNIALQPKPTDGAVSAAPSGFPRFFTTSIPEPREAMFQVSR